MTSQLRRELTVGAVLAATLATGLVVSRTEHEFILAGVVMLGSSVWMWPRVAHHKVRSRVSTPIVVGMIGCAVALWAGLAVGAAMVGLGFSVAFIGAAALERVRLRGAPLPAHGEAHGRVTFEGTTHALGRPPHLPGMEHAVAVWVARQGRKRWSSTNRVELRGKERKVQVDPASARLRCTPWILTPLLARDAARELDGADPDRPIHVWSLSDGDPVYVVGGATIENDPGAPTFRDPESVSVFIGDLVIGMGRRSLAWREVNTRLALWTALAAGAGTLAVLG